MWNYIDVKQILIGGSRAKIQVDNMNEDKTEYYCDECPNKIIYTLKEAYRVLKRYGVMLCKRCIGLDYNGIRRKIDNNRYNM